MGNIEIVVKNKDTLLKYLLNNIKNKSKNNIKTLLKNNRVLVNNKVVTKFDYQLENNDVISIDLNYQFKEKFTILYEDKYLLIVDKPYNMLTISTGNNTDSNLYYYVSEYVKSKNKGCKVFIINRLDKDTSGIVFFAKNEKIKYDMQNNWDSVKRKYIAIVHGITDDNGVVRSYLKENSNYMVYSSSSGKLAITEYKKIKSNKEYTLLEIIIHTGRKNQIRVHMKDINHPILGDRKYGIKDNAKRMYLHSNEVIFNHPITKKEIKINSKCLFDI